MTAREETLNLARQVPSNVLEVLRFIAPIILSTFDAPNPYMVAYKMGLLEDEMFLGNLMIEIYKIDKDATNWLVDETGQFDGDKLKLAIIALDLEVTDSDELKNVGPKGKG